MVVGFRLSVIQSYLFICGANLLVRGTKLLICSFVLQSHLFAFQKCKVIIHSSVAQNRLFATSPWYKVTYKTNSLPPLLHHFIHF